MFVRYQKGEKYATNEDYTEQSDTMDAFEDCGYLLDKDDVIVDIDHLDRSVIQKMISQFSITTKTVWTDRGVHFYFKKPKGFSRAKSVIALGFEVEYKHLKNTRDVCVKRNGIEREVTFPELRAELPKIFEPIRGLNESCLGLEDGEGRNNALFKMRTKLSGFSDWLEILTFINNYIFAEPLPQKEFQAITREMDIQPSKGNEFEMASWLADAFKIHKLSESLYHKTDLGYVQDHGELKRLIYERCSGVKSTYVEEVFRQMMLRTPEVSANEGFPIVFKNGILFDGEFYPVIDDRFTPHYVDVNYYPDAEPVEIVDRYIDQLTGGDENYRFLLLEILGHTLITNAELKRALGRFFIFVGDGGNGKGTLLQIVRTILGAKNCSSLSIKNLRDERYMYSMRGKLVNLGDDVQDEAIDYQDMKMLKNISTCDTIELRRLYEQSASDSLTTSLIFTSNHILKSFEKGESYRRRVVWAPMYSKPSKKDPKFISKLTTDKALEYWIRLFIEGYFRLYKQTDFTHSKVVDDFNTQYHEINDATLMFVNDYSKEEFLNRKPKEVYDEFQIWAEENDVSGSKKMLLSTIEKEFGLVVRPTWMNGKTVRVFVERE